jgi:predicted PurR-regulated permease PerM
VTSQPDTPRRLIVWAITAVAATVVLVWLLYLAREVLLLMYVSALFAIGFSPLVRLLERQRLFPIGTRRLPRWLAILALYVGILAVAVGLGFLIIPPLAAQAREFWAQLPTMIEQAQRYLVERGYISRPMTTQDILRRAPVGQGADAVGTVLGALWGVVGGVVGIVTILILSFYLLVESGSILATFVRLFPRERRSRVEAVAREITFKVSAWLGGQLVLAAVIGVSAAIGLGILGVPFFYVLAVIAAVGEVIPVVGPLLAAIPGIAVAFSVSGTTALWVAIFYLAQQQLENHILVPKLMERQLGMSPVTVIVALLVGSALLGIVGALLAVPTAAIVQVLVQELVLGDDTGDPAQTGMGGG